MSIVLNANNVPARDLWPAGLGNTKGPGLVVDDLPAWRTVPNSYAEVCQWAEVLTSEDATKAHSAKHNVIYSISTMQGTNWASKRRVIIRLQGFLGAFNLGPLGNWDGSEHGAPKATQYMKLRSGGCAVPFAAQKATVMHLQEMVLRSLGKHVEDDLGDDDILRLERRVFTRVDPAYNTDIESVLRTEDDPAGRAAKIARRWKVSHTIRTGIQQADGRITDTKHVALRQGDFVETLAVIEVASVRQKKGFKTLINIAPVQVIQVWSAVEALAKYPDIQTRKAVGQGSAVVDPDIGFALEDGLDSMKDMQVN